MMRPVEQKRHLSKQQKQRIVQAHKQQNAHNALVIAQRRTSVKVLLYGKMHTAIRRANVSDVVVGDFVACEKTQGRLRIVARRTRYNAFYGMVHNIRKTFAANIDALVFVCAPVPQFDIALLEQALLSACVAGIEVILVCNKQDLVNQVTHDDLQTMLKLHQNYGRTLFYTSALHNDYQTLATRLQQGTYLLFGQSGVGKSALLNCLFPKVDVATQVLSKRTQLGQHTTSVAHLYQQGMMNIIDCPGVRILCAPQEGYSSKCIESVYPDVGVLARQCRFRNCAHGVDQGCAVQALCEEQPSIQIERFLLLNRTLETFAQHHERNEH